MTEQIVVSVPVEIEGSWPREARRVTMLAQELGLALDDEALLWYDVRELVTLRLRLQEALNRPRRPQAGRLTRRGAPRWPRVTPRPQQESHKDRRLGR